MRKIPDRPAATPLIERAVQQIGSQWKLAKSTGFSQHAVWHAIRTGRVSAEMAVAIDRATDGAVSKEQLRPDLFQTQQETAA